MRSQDEDQRPHLRPHLNPLLKGEETKRRKFRTPPIPLIRGARKGLPLSRGIKGVNFERVFAAIHAIYSVVKANYTIDIFHTDEESMPFTAWFFNL